jgi:hypothetical protein
MRPFRVVATTIVGAAVCACGTLAVPAYAADVISPRPALTPSPLKSGGSLAPVLPPEGLPTAPPPHAIKPVVPQARIDGRELEPAAARPQGDGR